METQNPTRDEVLSKLAGAAEERRFTPLRDVNPDDATAVIEAGEQIIRLADTVELWVQGFEAFIAAFPDGPEKTLAKRRHQEAVFWLTESVIGK